MQCVKVFKSGSAVVTSHFKLSMSFFLQSRLRGRILKSDEQKLSLLKLVELMIKTNGICRTHLFLICYHLFLFIQTFSQFHTSNDGHVFDNVNTLENIMRTGTEFISEIFAATIFTSFNFHIFRLSSFRFSDFLVKGR